MKCKVLADHHQALSFVTPSWEKLPEGAVPNTETTNAPKPQVVPTSTPVTVPSGPRDRAADSSNPSTLTISAQTIKVDSTRPQKLISDNAVASSSGTPVGKESNETARNTPAPRPSAEDFISQKPISDAGPSSTTASSSDVSARPSTLERLRSGREFLGGPSRLSSSKGGRELLPSAKPSILTSSTTANDSSPRSLAPHSDNNRELLPWHVQQNGDLLHPRELLSPARQAQIDKISNGSNRELLPVSSSAPMTASSPSDPFPGPSTSASISTPSLAERLGMATSSQPKRSRDDPPHFEAEIRPSLLSRLGSRGDTPEAKRIKENIPASQPSAPSLLSRMGRSDGTNGLPVPQSAPPALATTPAQLLSIKNHSIPSPIPLNGINIFSHSTSVPSQTAPSPIPLSILNRSQSSSSSLSIRNHSTTARVPEKYDDDPDEGVVRKGRGFKRDPSPEDILMIPATPLPAPIPRGPLRRPGLMMRGSAGRGR